MKQWKDCVSLRAHRLSASQYAFLFLSFVFIFYHYFFDPPLLQSAALIICNFALLPKLALLLVPTSGNSKTYVFDFDEDLPRYSVIVPLFKEAHLVPDIVKNIRLIKYDLSKLEVFFVLENSDVETRAAFLSVELPKNFSLIVVPYSMPQTKGKALNYAMSFATGDYITIYDAEDVVDKYQLLKAAQEFKQNPDCACIQAKLVCRNYSDNFLTRMFSIEYGLIFDKLLGSLAQMSLPVPLGGSSNHFRANILRSILWNPYNVTEDADIGVHFYKKQHKISIMHSYTFEELPNSWLSWCKQRSRWIKGYLQTYFWHMQFVRQFKKMPGFIGIVMLHIIFLLPNLGLLVAPFALFALFHYSAGITDSYFFLTLFNWLVFAISFAVRACTFCHKMKHINALYGLFFPFYLLMQFFPCLLAFYELVFRPYYWHKTKHGIAKSTIKL